MAMEVSVDMSEVSVDGHGSVCRHVHEHIQGCPRICLRYKGRPSHPPTLAPLVLVPSHPCTLWPCALSPLCCLTPLSSCPCSLCPLTPCPCALSPCTVVPFYPPPLQPFALLPLHPYALSPSHPSALLSLCLFILLPFHPLTCPCALSPLCPLALLPWNGFAHNFLNNEQLESSQSPLFSQGAQGHKGMSMWGAQGLTLQLNRGDSDYSKSLSGLKIEPFLRKLWTKTFQSGRAWGREGKRVWGHKGIRGVRAWGVQVSNGHEGHESLRVQGARGHDGTR